MTNQRASLEQIEQHWKRRNSAASFEGFKQVGRNDDIRDKLENTLLVGMVAGLCIGLFLSSWI